MVNVIPLNDEKEHAGSAECWCNPRVEWQDKDGTIYRNGPIVIHNAADCREFVERLTGEGIAEDKRWANYVD